MVISRDQNAGRSHSIKTDNSSFERVEHFRCLRTNVTDQNSVQEEIKNILKSRNACQSFVLKFAVKKCKDQDRVTIICLL